MEKLEDRIIERLKYKVSQARLEYSEKGIKMRVLEQELRETESFIDRHNKDNEKRK